MYCSPSERSLGCFLSVGTQNSSAQPYVDLNHPSHTNGCRYGSLTAEHWLIGLLIHVGVMEDCQPGGSKDTWGSCLKTGIQTHTIHWQWTWHFLKNIIDKVVDQHVIKVVDQHASLHGFIESPYTLACNPTRGLSHGFRNSFLFSFWTNLRKKFILDYYHLLAVGWSVRHCDSNGVLRRAPVRSIF